MNAIIINGWASGTEIWNDFIRKMDFDKTVMISNETICNSNDVRRNAVDAINNGLKEIHGDYIIIGWSMGSLVAVDVIEDLERRPAGLVIMSGEMSHDVDAVNLLMENLKTDAQKYLDAFFRQAMTRQEKLNFFAASTGQEGSSFKGGLDADKLIIGLKYLRDTDLRCKLNSVDLPVLWLHGDEDAICSFSSGKMSSQLLSNCRFVGLNGVGHVPFRTAQNECVKEVMDFIGKCAEWTNDR